MKIQPARADAFVAKPDPAIFATLIFGPDRGLVRERARALMAGLGVLADDPFATTDLPEDEIKADPARLADEMRAMAFGGGPRAVRLRASGDAAAAVITEILSDLDAAAWSPAATLIVEAGDLPARSKLRKAFEGAQRGASVPCYADGVRELDALIDAALAADGLSIDADARAALAPRLQGDRALARAELAKLILFVGPGSGATVSLADVDASASGAEPADFDTVVTAALDGDAAAADASLTIALESGLAPIAIGRALQRQLLRLHAARVRLDQTGDAEAAMKALRPPLFGPRRTAFKRQLGRWPLARLSQALAHTLQTEQRMKTAGAAEAALIGRLLLAIAQMARRRG